MNGLARDPGPLPKLHDALRGAPLALPEPPHTLHRARPLRRPDRHRQGAAPRASACGGAALRSSRPSSPLREVASDTEDQGTAAAATR